MFKKNLVVCLINHYTDIHLFSVKEIMLNEERPLIFQEIWKILSLEQKWKECGLDAVGSEYFF